MTWRKGHGRGAGKPRIETLPADELPAGIPAAHEERTQEHAPTRDSRGRFPKGNPLAAVGGRATAGRSRLAERMSLADLPEDSAFRPYKNAGAKFRRAHCGVLAKTVGGGVCGPAPSSLVSTAALQLAWSRFLSDKAGVTMNVELIAMASKLADASRQSLMAAHELCAREAEARAKRKVAQDAFGAFVDAARAASPVALQRGPGRPPKSAAVVESAMPVGGTVPEAPAVVVVDAPPAAVVVEPAAEQDSTPAGQPPEFGLPKP